MKEAQEEVSHRLVWFLKEIMYMKHLECLVHSCHWNNQARFDDVIMTNCSFPLTINHNQLSFKIFQNRPFEWLHSNVSYD